jgi:hypothetical protein
VTTEFGLGASYNLARQFVESNAHELKRCAGLAIAGDDPCDLENQAASALYRLPAALPYAFVASEETLLSQADSITSENARRATVLSHQLDTIVIEATSDAPRDYLIIQETHFPGWRAWVDDIAVETITVGNQIPQGPTGGFVGLPMLSGTHVYTLRYEAPGFNAGLLISLLTLLLLPFYLFDFRPFRRKKEAVTSTASEILSEN